MPVPGRSAGPWFRPWLSPRPALLPAATGPRVVNQWAVTFAQPAAFGTTPPALQSTVIALTPAASVMTGGTGTPTAGNWLVCVAGWNQSGLTASTVGDADDVHSFWRPGDVTASSWAVSASAGATRTSVWYTPNLARAAQDVYVAPNGAQAGRACLVFEIAGMGPWDVVTAVASNYAAAATSLGLSLAAPSAQAFVIAAVTGDSAAAGQALTPAGWSSLATVTATNGTDHTCDAVLTTACLVTSGSVSVTATATSATDLSGVIIGFLTSAPSPIPATANPAWAGRMILEAAFGAGAETPADQMTWTALSDSAWAGTWGPASQGYKRFWGWQDASGVPYALGQLQSSTGAVQVDNWDGACSPLDGAAAWSFTTAGTPVAGTYFIVTAGQAASIAPGQAFTDTANPGTLFTVTGVGQPFAGFVNISFAPAAAAVMASPDTVTQVSPLTGVPVRLRMALGTLADGTVVNRWYTWARNSLAWPERRNKALRGFVPVTLTDIWSAVSGAGPSPYRGEVEQDAPYSWYPMDDQPLAGGVLPTSLRNAALGNTTVLPVVASPAGITGGDAYDTSGRDATAGANVNQNVATYSVGANQGWMYGDPQSSPQSYSTGNPVTSSPGSAAWQQTGFQGNTGANGWFLAVNDAGFPPLSGGVTVAGWFNAAFFGTSAGYTNSGTLHPVCGEPYANLTIATLSTGSAPVVILQMDRATGHLNLITYNGTTPTSHAVYTTSDLRTNSWQCVHIVLTTTTWAVYVNGGLTATASGSVAAMTSAWTWLTLCGDYGNTHGGSSPASIQNGGNLALSHWAVFTGQLPAWRILAHYSAAITGFGVLPAPTGLSLTSVNGSGTGFTPDGALSGGSYGSTGVAATNYTFSALAVAVAGSYTSGPSARAVFAGLGTNSFGDAVFASWTALAPKVNVYTAASVNAETDASTAAGSGDAYSSGFGGSASAAGVCHVAGGTGASPPASASSLGDTVAHRIERILGYAQVTCPNRAIDSTASLLVQAATDIGGQQAGGNIQNLVDSDNGLLFVDNNGTLCYKSRAHLAADQAAGAVWQIGMNTITGMVPFDDSIEWSSDPQRIYDAITVTPFSPDGASLASLTPSSAATANAAQAQFGIRPKAVTSYLQDATKIQAAADWWLATFGQLRRRAAAVAVNAATYPGGWLMACGMNPGDLAQIYDAGPFGQQARTGVYRVSQIARSVSYGANGSAAEAKLVLVLDPLPASYWS